ncbi:uncharacterized protein LOC124537064 [Vanessa cardui]|uniref:uncharacterized protein LOC124537064 n=1 Tax=Vanessa cardui TaxID=171605 RepID=UPI001F12A3EC|nr:uncharacterized protein LOC124537064 [Vanessa cardui]
MMKLSLGKFGLNHCDLPTMFSNMAVLLRFVTVNIDKKNKKRIPLVFYLITTIVVLTYLYAYVFSMLWLVFFRYGKSNIEAASGALAFCTCSITCMTKFGYMKFCAKEVCNTVERFLKCDSRVIPGTRFAKNLRKNLRVIKRRATVIWLFLISDASIYILIPFLIPGRLFTVEFFIIYGLEPMLETPNYEIATTASTISVAFAVYTMVSGAVYVIVIVGYNEAQMYTLSEELITIWDDSQNFYNHIKHRITDNVHDIDIQKKIMNDFIEIRLKDIIRFHIENISLQHEFDHEIRPIIATEYFINGICIIAELLGGLDKTYLQLPYTFVQIAMDCVSGQRLIDACNQFEKTIYSCKWENFNRTNQRTVLLMLMMSQKTLTLSAGGVLKLNFVCLMNILKSTYSTYTTLKSIV